MLIQTTRFGTIEFQPDDVLLFPQGIIGFEQYRHWILAGDAEIASLAWLQNLSQPDLAVAVVSPRRFVQDYQVRLQKRQLDDLQLRSIASAYVLVILNRHGSALTLNLRSPLVVNLDQRIGKQVITTDEQSLQHVVARVTSELRKSA